MSLPLNRLFIFLSPTSTLAPLAHIFHIFWVTYSMLWCTNVGETKRNDLFEGCWCGDGEKLKHIQSNLCMFFYFKKIFQMSTINKIPVWYLSLCLSSHFFPRASEKPVEVDGTFHNWGGLAKWPTGNRKMTLNTSLLVLTSTHLRMTWSLLEKLRDLCWEIHYDA